jgi:hypothetical protein
VALDMLWFDVRVPGQRVNVSQSKPQVRVWHASSVDRAAEPIHAHAVMRQHQHQLHTTTPNCRFLPAIKIPRRRHGRRSTSSIVRVHNEALALAHQRSSMDKRSVDRALGHHANGAGEVALPSVKG